MNLVIVVNVGLLFAALVSLLVTIDHMTKATRNSIRCGIIVLFVAVLAQIAGYFDLFGWSWDNWADTLLFGGVAMVGIANVRRPSGACREEISDRYAYGVGALTALGLLIAWVST